MLPSLLLKIISMVVILLATLSTLTVTGFSLYRLGLIMPHVFGDPLSAEHSDTVYHILELDQWIKYFSVAALLSVLVAFQYIPTRYKRLWTGIFVLNLLIFLSAEYNIRVTDYELLRKVLEIDSPGKPTKENS